MIRHALATFSFLAPMVLPLAALPACDDDSPDPAPAAQGAAGSGPAAGRGGAGGGAAASAGRGGAAGEPGGAGGQGGGQGGNASAAPFLLLHGAWNGAWVWDDVAAGLRAGGAEVSTVELPAHGADATPVAGATFDAYVSKVTEALDAAGAPAILVAHSMGGIVATQAAERRPERVAKLVYLAAYVPKTGESLQSLAQKDSGSLAGPALIVNAEAGTAGLPPEQLGPIFCADCPAPALARLQANYRDEPLAPLGAAVEVTEANWGRVPRHYIFTSQDKAVSPALQLAMTEGVSFASTATIDASHAPFLSRPELVTSTLLGLR